MVFLLLKGFEILPASVPGNFELDLMKAGKIEDLYFSTNTLNAQRLEDVHVWYGSNASGKGIQASIRVYLNTNLSSSFATDYTVKIEGHCGESYFIKKDRLWHNTHPLGFTIDNCKLWWPKNAGEPSLYDTTVTLLKKGEICDIYHLKAGVRTVELDLTDSTDKDGNGEFCFKVNGKKIFVLGTNWVPLDAFHSNDSNRLPQALSLLNDIGCNMVRCWGGNVYESAAFFDYCDEHGIMVWQDFAMGCSVYPDEDRFAKALEEEAIYEIKRLRNHASLALWAGDNECDQAHSWSGFKRDPNRNRLTRNVLRRAVEMHDYARLKQVITASRHHSLWNVS